MNADALEAVADARRAWSSADRVHVRTRDARARFEAYADALDGGERGGEPWADVRAAIDRIGGDAGRASDLGCLLETPDGWDSSPLSAVRSAGAYREPVGALCDAIEDAADAGAWDEGEVEDALDDVADDPAAVADAVTLCTNLARTALELRDHQRFAVQDALGTIYGEVGDPLTDLDEQPIALLPVRLETRFVDENHDLADERELWIRTYPDEIHVDDHEPELTDAEVRHGKRFWGRLWHATRPREAIERAYEDGSIDDLIEEPWLREHVAGVDLDRFADDPAERHEQLKRRLWGRLTERFDPERAAYVIHALAPTDEDGGDASLELLSGPLQSVELDPSATLETADLQPIDGEGSSEAGEGSSEVGDGADDGSGGKAGGTGGGVPDRLRDAVSRKRGTTRLDRSERPRVDSPERRHEKRSVDDEENDGNDDRATDGGTDALAADSIRGLRFPDVPRRASPWGKQANARLLPDRWVAIVEWETDDGIERRTIGGDPIPDPLPVGPRMELDEDEGRGDDRSAGEDGELDGDGGERGEGSEEYEESEGGGDAHGDEWLLDVETAFDVGMALRVPLSDLDGYDPGRGFERIVVLGVKASMDASETPDALRRLLGSHQYTDGFSVLRTGTETNVPADDPSGALDPDPIAPGPPRVEHLDLSDGDLLARSLAVDPDPAEAHPFGHVRGADLTEQLDARHANSALWPATIGYALTHVLVPNHLAGEESLWEDGPSPIADVEEFDRLDLEGKAAWLDAYRRHFVRYVRARGPLPTIRLGDQPYGVLPVTTSRDLDISAPTLDPSHAVALERGEISIEEVREAGVDTETLVESEVPTPALVEAGADPRDLHDHGVDAVELLDAGVSAEVLRELDAGVEELAENGVELPKLVQAGFEAIELERVGATIRDVAQAGGDPEQLARAGATVAQLAGVDAPVEEIVRAGFAARDLLDAGFTVKEVVEGGAPPSALREIEVDAATLRALEVPAGSLRVAGIPADELLKAGYDAIELLNGGFSETELGDTGVTVGDVADVGRSAAELAREGTTVGQLRAKGFGPDALLESGFVPDELLEAGYTVGEVLDAGADVAALVDAGNVGALRAAGVPVDELREAGATVEALREAGTPAEALAAIGVDPEELSAAGYTRADLEAAGVDLEELLDPAEDDVDSDGTGSEDDDTSHAAGDDDADAPDRIEHVRTPEPPGAADAALYDFGFDPARSRSLSTLAREREDDRDAPSDQSSEKPTEATIGEKRRRSGDRRADRSIDRRNSPFANVPFERRTVGDREGGRADATGSSDGGGEGGAEDDPIDVEAIRTEDEGSKDAMGGETKGAEGGSDRPVDDSPAIGSRSLPADHHAVEFDPIAVDGISGAKPIDVPGVVDREVAIPRLPPVDDRVADRIASYLRSLRPAWSEAAERQPFAREHDRDSILDVLDRSPVSHAAETDLGVESRRRDGPDFEADRARYVEMLEGYDLTDLDPRIASMKRDHSTAGYAVDPEQFVDADVGTFLELVRAEDVETVWKLALSPLAEYLDVDESAFEEPLASEWDDLGRTERRTAFFAAIETADDPVELLDDLLAPMDGAGESIEGNPAAEEAIERLRIAARLSERYDDGGALGSLARILVQHATVQAYAASRFRLGLAYDDLPKAGPDFSRQYGGGASGFKTLRDDAPAALRRDVGWDDADGRTDGGEDADGEGGDDEEPDEVDVGSIDPAEGTIDPKRSTVDPIDLDRAGVETDAAGGSDDEGTENRGTGDDGGADGDSKTIASGPAFEFDEDRSNPIGRGGTVPESEPTKSFDPSEQVADDVVAGGFDDFVAYDPDEVRVPWEFETPTYADVLELVAGDDPTATAIDPRLSEFADSVAHLEGCDPEEVGRLVADVLDLSSHRLDAWWTSLATKRLFELRERQRLGDERSDDDSSDRGREADRADAVDDGESGDGEDDASSGGDGNDGESDDGYAAHETETAAAGRSSVEAGDPDDPGLYVGGYGLVENLAPSDRESPSFVHAPSQQQATTAALLRSGYLANERLADEDDRDDEPTYENLQAMDLSARRVRDATELIQGVRRGQELGELLGYRFERRLHEETIESHDERAGGGAGDDEPTNLMVYRRPLREAFPGVEGQLGHADGHVPPDDADPEIARSDVLDGMALLEHWDRYPFGRADDLPDESDEAYDLLTDLVAELERAVTAVGDLLLAEGIHQLARGDLDRAGSSLGALSDGEYLPDPQVTTVPRSETGLVHRQLVVLDPIETDLDEATGADERHLRAAAEPTLERWVASLLPAHDDVGCVAAYRWLDADGDPETHRTEAFLDDLDLSGLDLLSLSRSADRGSATELEARLAYHLRRNPPEGEGIPTDATIEVEVTRTETAPISVASALEVARSLRRVIEEGSAGSGADLAHPGGDPEAGHDRDAAAELEARASAVEARFERLVADLESPLSTLGYDEAEGVVRADEAVTRDAEAIGDALESIDEDAAFVDLDRALADLTGADASGAFADLAAALPAGVTEADRAPEEVHVEAATDQFVTLTPIEPAGEDDSAEDGAGNDEGPEPDGGSIDRGPVRVTAWGASKTRPFVATAAGTLESGTVEATLDFDGVDPGTPFAIVASADGDPIAAADGRVVGDASGDPGAVLPDDGGPVRALRWLGAVRDRYDPDRAGAIGALATGIERADWETIEAERAAIDVDREATILESADADAVAALCDLSSLDLAAIGDGASALFETIDDLGLESIIDAIGAGDGYDAVRLRSVRAADAGDVARRLERAADGADARVRDERLTAAIGYAPGSALAVAATPAPRLTEDVLERLLSADSDLVVALGDVLDDPAGSLARLSAWAYDPDALDAVEAAIGRGGDGESEDEDQGARSEGDTEADERGADESDDRTGSRAAIAADLRAIAAEAALFVGSDVEGSPADPSGRGLPNEVELPGVDADEVRISQALESLAGAVESGDRTSSNDYLASIETDASAARATLADDRPSIRAATEGRDVAVALRRAVLERVRYPLFEASYAGVIGAVPTEPVGSTPDDEASIAADARRALEALRLRLRAAEGYRFDAGDADPAEAEPDDEAVDADHEDEIADANGDDVRSRLADARARLDALFDGDLTVLTPFEAKNGAELERTFGDESLLADAEPLAAETWLQRVARVRDRPARFRDALSYAEALSGSLARDLSVGQLPYRPDDRWLGADGWADHLDPEEARSRVSLVAQFGPDVGPADVGGRLTALVVDEWIEEIPSDEETTGVALNYDDPSVRAPQSVLLAVPPEGETWTLGTLAGAVSETMAYARYRSVDQRDLGGIRRLLPALYFPWDGTRNSHADFSALEWYDADYLDSFGGNPFFRPYGRPKSGAIDDTLTDISLEFEEDGGDGS